MNIKTDIQAVSGHHPAYAQEIAAVVRSNLTPKLMRDRIENYHENDIAEALELLRKEERSRLYHVLDAEFLADILSHSDRMDEYMLELGMRRRAEILAQLEPAEASDYLRRTDRLNRSTLIDLMDSDTRRGIVLLSSFDEDQIGSCMTTNYIAIPDGISVRQAMKELVAQAADNDNISTLYVVDEDGGLVGAMDLKDLIIARETTPLTDITATSYPYVYAAEQIEDCIEQLKDYSEDSIPVLDSHNQLCGVLTAQTLTELVDSEMSEDYAKLAGLAAEEDLQEPLRRSIAKRLPWLIVLLGLGLIVSSVVGLFEHVVAELTLIVAFQSLILDMAGNVGTQSLAVTIRVLMDEDLSGRQKLELVGKEARVGLSNGLILGVLSFLLIGLYLTVLRGQPLQLAFGVSLCTGAALVVSMFLSGICGTVVPITFKRLHIDPAVASGPLITTINDLVAVITYYGLAWLLLLQLFHF